MAHISKQSANRGARGRAEGKEEVLSLRERFSALRYLIPLLKWVWAVSPSITLLNGLVRIVRSAVPVSLLWVGKLIIDEVVLLVNGNGGDISHVMMLVGVELGLAIFSDMLGRTVALLDSLLGDLFTNDTSVRLMNHAARLELTHFEDANFHDKLERARRQTTGRMMLLSQVLGQLQDFITILTLASGLVVLAPWLIFLLILALVPALLGEAHFNGLTYSLMYAWTPERRELDYLRYIGASNEMAKEVKIFGLSDFITTRYRNLADRLYEENRKLAVRRAVWGSFLTAIGSSGYYVGYGVIIWRTVNGEFSIGDLTFLAGSFSRLRALLEGMLLRFSDVSERALYLKDLFDFFEIEPEVAAPDNPRPFPYPIREGFHFENVGFRYPGTDRWVLRNVSFTLRAGEKLALVGENGAGKTTLVKLLARLYDPSEGQILLDGYDLREYDLNELRQNIGVIFQDFVRYDMVVSENLAIGRIEERDDRDRIEHAARRSLADGIITRLPRGYQQMVGRRFADGVDLSGGEWQKIALGRAYMRDAQLLILDEPTAALDARAEYEIFQRFTDLTREKMAVLISHRFSTVRMADRILVLENGQPLELGTHAELLARDGRYAELFNLQAAGYQ